MTSRGPESDVRAGCRPDGPCFRESKQIICNAGERSSHARVGHRDPRVSLYPGLQGSPCPPRPPSVKGHWSSRPARAGTHRGLSSCASFLPVTPRKGAGHPPPLAQPGPVTCPSTEPGVGVGLLHGKPSSATGRKATCPIPS